MAYSDDAVKAKLAALNETQDSIVSNAQWIMFHRRNADRTASLWLNRLQENTNPAKRLNLIYLANEVVQQSRARSKQDFLLAFEPLIADATAAAYKGASQDIQNKLRRVIEVWRQRGIFDSRIQEQVEKRLEELDKQKGGKSLGGAGARLGGSLFASTNPTAPGIAPELEDTNKAFLAFSKADAASKAPVLAAENECKKWSDAETPVSSASVQAARLRGLVKDLSAANVAVSAKITAQKELIQSLEKLLELHRAKLTEDEALASELSTKTSDAQRKVTEVEDSIMRRQDGVVGANGHSSWDTQDANRPATEGFTPPPPDVESFTPPAGDDGYNDISATDNSTALEETYTSTTGADLIQEQPQSFNEPPPSHEPPQSLAQQEAAAAAAAQDFLRNLIPQTRQASGEAHGDTTTDSGVDTRLKRRKIGHKTGDDMDEDIFGSGSVGGVDEDSISAMLKP